MEDAAPLLMKDCSLQTGVDGYEYMPPVKSDTEKEPSMARMEAFRSLGAQCRPGQSYSGSIIQPPIKILYSMSGYDDERILNHLESRCFLFDGIPV